MNSNILKLAGTLLICPIVLHGDSMIGNFINSLGNTRDISKTNPGVKRVGSGPFYIYKLNNGSGYRSTPTQPRTNQEIRQVNVDVKPERDVINAHKKSEEPAEQVVQDEKETLYGADDSPLRDPNVKAAWNRARDAERRLEAHRDYMERVRKARNRVSDAKSTSPGVASKVADD